MVTSILLVLAFVCFAVEAVWRRSLIGAGLALWVLVRLAAAYRGA